MQKINAHKYISWDLVQDVNAICKPLFENFQINYFDYARFYSNGDTLLLFSDGNYVECFLNDKKYLTPPSIIKPGFHLWHSYLDVHFTSIAKHGFGHDHGITLAIENKNYTEIYNFATVSENYKIYDIYMNNQVIIYKFIAYFQEKAIPLLRQLEKNRIDLSDRIDRKLTVNLFDETLDCFTTLTNLNTYSVVIPKQGTFNFTKREAQSLAFLLRGNTTKEIARKLDVSPRTIDDYINNIKRKLGCNSKLEVISQFTNENIILPFEA